MPITLDSLLPYIALIVGAAVVTGVIAAFVTARIMAPGSGGASAPSASGSRPAAVPAPAAAAGPDYALIAAIAAAAVSAGRVVHIGEAPSSNWALQTRARHHTSHSPRYQ
jgi:hypothetical protein